MEANEIRIEDLPIDFSRCSKKTASELLASAQLVLELPPSPSGKEIPSPGRGSQSPPASAPALIGISGKSRSGKDTVARILVSTYKGVAQVSFSDGIIEEVNDWLRPHGRKITESNKSLPVNRSLLQTWGAARREEDPEYWTRAMQQKIEKLWQQGTTTVVATGVRALSDLQLIEKMGGVHWRVVRPENNYSAEHAIEKELDDSLQDATIIENPEKDPAALEAIVLDLFA